jgi:hypothetical protein
MRLKEKLKQFYGEKIIEVIKTEENISYNITEVAQIISELFGDTCACNFNDIDAWLPYCCKYSETECPNLVDELGCWKEYLLHRHEKSSIMEEQYETN